MRKAEKRSAIAKRTERQKGVKQHSKHTEENTDIRQQSAVQLPPIRGSCCCICKGKVTTTPLQPKTFDTKDISLINFMLGQCHASSSNVAACGHSVTSPEDILAAGVLL